MGESKTNPVRFGRDLQPWSRRSVISSGTKPCPRLFSVSFICVHTGLLTSQVTSCSWKKDA